VLAERCTAVGQVAELEARVAELEAQGHQFEAERVKAEEAQRNVKHGKESGQCLPSPFCAILPLTCFLFRAGGLHQGQLGASEAPRGG